MIRFYNSYLFKFIIFEFLVVKILSLKQQNQILLATMEKN